MSEHDNEMYQTMLGKVQRQIKTLRVMLANIQVYTSILMCSISLRVGSSYCSHKVLRENG